MTTIAVSTTQLSEEPSVATVRLSIIVSEADWVGLFDQIQVFRSLDGPDGPFEELTATSWSPARLPKTAGDQPSSPVTGASVNIVGEELELSIDLGLPLTITFSGSNPLTLAAVAAQIISQGLSALLVRTTPERRR